MTVCPGMPDCEGPDCGARRPAPECWEEYQFTYCSDAPPPPPPPGECATDADCPNGYCEHYATCAALGCPPPPPSQCLYANCDDGSQLMCRMSEPTCAPGETAAIRTGCWACVDARTCQGNGGSQCDAYDPSQPFCDAEPWPCPAGTISAARNGCWACVDPTTCQEVFCHDGSEPICFMEPPLCGPNEVLAIQNGCYNCVNPATCQ